MKTLLNLTSSSCHLCTLILFCCTLLLPWTACTDPDPEFHTTFPPIQIFDPANDYVGTFDLMDDDCNSTSYTIEISRYALIGDNDQIISPLDKPRIYISNLVENGRNPVIAEWDGTAFIVYDQDLHVDNEQLKVSARLFEYEGELSVNYNVSGPLRNARCSGKFRKIQ
jgi:hypothetical protein